MKMPGSTSLVSLGCTCPCMTPSESKMQLSRQSEVKRGTLTPHRKEKVATSKIRPLFFCLPRDRKLLREGPRVCGHKMRWESKKGKKTRYWRATDGQTADSRLDYQRRCRQTTRTRGSYMLWLDSGSLNPHYREQRIDRPTRFRLGF